MATALQCPDCGRDQPLDQVSGTTFRCRRCGRMLAAPRRPSPVPDDDRTVAVPAAVEAETKPVPKGEVETRRAPEGRDGASAERDWASAEHEAPSPPPPAAPELPSSWRALVWLVALPIGLVLAAAPLRAIGWLSVDDALDAFAGSGLGRWAILLALLPLWAAISASLAHLAIEALARRRASPRT